MSIRATSCLAPNDGSSPFFSSASSSAPAVHQKARSADCAVTSSIDAIASRIMVAPLFAPRSHSSNPR
jgi:hypothetical protein